MLSAKVFHELQPISGGRCSSALTPIIIVDNNERAAHLLFICIYILLIFILNSIVLGCHPIHFVKLAIEVRAVVESAAVDNLLHGQRGRDQQLGGKRNPVRFDKIIRRWEVEILKLTVEISHAHLHVGGKCLRRHLGVIKILVYVIYNLINKCLILFLYQLAAGIFEGACRSVIILLED